MKTLSKEICSNINGGLVNPLQCVQAWINVYDAHASFNKETLTLAQVGSALWSIPKIALYCDESAHQWAQDIWVLTNQIQALVQERKDQAKTQA